jgi:hypothetical protein
MMRLSAAFMRRGAAGVAVDEDGVALTAELSAPLKEGIEGCNAGLT